ncbi:MAG: branched-chain alpha-keto acid dehydrogenase subunit E2, partial [Gallionella sp.]|nr:branched-chain alpha-keto acid dehydrogenase subunit E2 [Gallionella sp.]
MAEIKQVLVPDIGDYKDVSVIEVMVKVGDTLNAEDTLLTLETDKAAMDVPSPYAGVVKELHVEIGDKVSQGSLILVLECAEQIPPSEIPPAPPFAKGGVEAAAASASPATAVTQVATAQP